MITPLVLTSKLSRITPIMQMLIIILGLLTITRASSKKLSNGSIEPFK